LEEQEQVKRELTKYLVLTQKKLEGLNKFYDPLIEKMNKGELGTIIMNQDYLKEYDKAYKEWEEANVKYRKLLDKYFRLKAIK